MTSSNHSSEKLFHPMLPIKRREYKKVIVLGILKILSSFLFTALKIHKDNNIVTTSGAEKVPYTKAIVFFFALFASICYTNASNRFRVNKLLYGILGTLLTLFVIYTFLLLPYGESLRPDVTGLLTKYKGNTFVENMLHVYKGWFKLFFYILAELFGQFSIIVFFWTIANELFDRNSAKRLYPIFTALGAIGGIAGALLETFLCTKVEDLKKTHTANTNEIVTEVSKQIGYIGIAVISLMIIVFWWVDRSFFEEKRRIGELDNKKESKEKVSFWQGIKHIANNPYLLATTSMIVCCAVASSLTDITYKGYLKQTRSLPSAYAVAEQYRVVLSLIFSFFGSLFIAPWMMRSVSWKATAYIAPIIIMCSGTFFFLLSIFKDQAALATIASWFSQNPIEFITSFGLLQSSLTTFVRYVFFDSSKEVVFAGLDPASRRKSKASVDVVGSRSGKGFSSMTHVFLLSLFSINGKIGSISHLLLVIFLVFCGGWIWSVSRLGSHLDTKKEVAKKQK